jgi:pyruvate,water dikinase
MRTSQDFQLSTETRIENDPSSASVLPLRSVGLGDVATVGGKGANLGELIRAGFPVPSGFVVTAASYLDAMERAGCRPALVEGTRNAGSMDDTSLRQFAARARNLVREAPVPTELAEALRVAMAENAAERVAVRSSATAEDAADTSFAGMNESFTNVTVDDLVERVHDCWISLFGDRVVAYRAERGLTDEPAIAVVVQHMLASDRAGVMFTTDESGSSMVIEGTFGLGEFVVAGTVEPDSYHVDRSTCMVTDVHIGDKTAALMSTADGQATQPLSADRAAQRVLSDAELHRLAELGMQIEHHYGAPQDIEWLFVGDELSIVQSRPITFAHTEQAGTPLLHGLGVGRSSATGRVRILSNPSEGKSFVDGEVLVARMTSPDWVPILRRAAGLVTDAGGSTCHAAIVSRELGIPGVVGTRTATSTLHDGELVTVDASRGTVTAGAAAITASPASGPNTGLVGGSAAAGSPESLATKIYVNLAISERAEEIAALPVDGVGLLRGEFLVTSALGGTHPRQLIAEGGGPQFVEQMSTELGRIAGAFTPRPVVYRAMDFRSNEFRNLRGGEQFEPHEENPMIGYRGCFRYIKDPETFALELDAVAATRAQWPNLQLMLPFVRTTWELEACLKTIAASPLGHDRSLRIWVMAEVPSIIYRIPEYAQLGIHGVSIGSNDLTQLMLGVDRDSELCAELFDASDGAVLWAIEHIVTACHRAGLTVSLCGQAPSDDPDFAAFLVGLGIDSISVNPDAVAPVRARVGAAERRLLVDAALSARTSA